MTLTQTVTISLFSIHSLVFLDFFLGMSMFQNMPFIPKKLDGYHFHLVLYFLEKVNLSPGSLFEPSKSFQVSLFLYETELKMSEAPQNLMLHRPRLGWNIESRFEHITVGDCCNLFFSFYPLSTYWSNEPSSLFSLFISWKAFSSKNILKPFLVKLI